MTNQTFLLHLGHIAISYADLSRKFIDLKYGLVSSLDPQIII